VSAVLQGFRAIDTACQPKHYREDLVGEALQILQDQHGIKREDLFLQTKFTPIAGQDLTKPIPYDPEAPLPAQISASFDVTLKNLRTTYIDSYLLHSPLATLPQTLRAWRSLCALQDEGKVRKIGLSNVYDKGVLEALGEERKVDVVQNSWYQGNGWDAEVSGYCRENGIQYQSFWTLSGSPSLLSHPSVLALAQAAKCTAAQAVFKIAQMQGITPLSGTTNDNHMREGVDVEHIELGQDADMARHLKTVREFVWR